MLSETVFTTRSLSLDKNDKCEIGLQLNKFLCRGYIF